MTAVAPGARPVSDPASDAVHDLLLVGAGASAAYVLLGLLDDLDRAPAGGPLRIVVVDRSTDAFSGVPYGSRAARTSLLITSLQDFLPDAERARFSAWLAANKDWAFAEYLASAGPWSARWWERHREQVERDDFDALYLPRYVFGEYLARRTRKAISRAEAAGIARTEVLVDEVVAVERAAAGYRVRCRGGELTARRVVLATGSAPVRSRLPLEAGAALLVDDPFDDMVGALERVRAAVGRRAASEPAHVVLIGGNAGTMDVLYQVNDQRGPGVGTAVFTVLSHRGGLPHRVDDALPAPHFTPERLQALVAAPEVAAAEVYRAALADIERGVELGLGVVDTLRPVSSAVGAVLPRLSDEQTVEFAARWGVELGRHQRRAGWEYYEVPEELTRQGRLHVVAGSFFGVDPDIGGGLRVRYRADGVDRELEAPADVVINCAGPAGSLRASGVPLLTQLLDDDVCRPTPGEGGIAVDDALEAAPGLHVMGPLLAGNVVNGAPVWHMEHCGRISAYGTALGSRLAGTLRAARG